MLELFSFFSNLTSIQRASAEWRGVDKNKTALKSFFLKLTVYEGSTTGPDSY